MIYTFGYAGQKIEKLKEDVEKLDAIIVDVRFSPWSKDKQWGQSGLIKEFGNRYKAGGKYFGNKNYQGDEIILADPLEGVKRIQQIGDRNIILMCGCWNFTTCHRRNVAELLESNGFKTMELSVWRKAEKEKQHEMKYGNQGSF
jgi:uncharacterized protein (DUF488 family)